MSPRYALCILTLDLNRVFKNDRLMRALTGLNLAAFDQLLESFSAAQEAAEPPSLERQRAPGAGRKANLQTMEDKLFYVLFYFKCYPYEASLLHRLNSAILMSLKH